MSYMGQDSGTHIGEHKFECAKGGFTHIQLPKRKMEKKIQRDIPAREMKFFKYSPHQRRSCGKVLNGWSFLHHIEHEHRGYCPQDRKISFNKNIYFI